MADLKTLTPSGAHAFSQERAALACAFRWAARFDLHEGVANHFSLAVDNSGKRFLINPNQRHFSLIRAGDLLLLDADDPGSMSGPDVPDPTAWGLHGALHRHCPHAVCAIHLHPEYATVLASLADSTMLPIDQNTAMFFNRTVIDDGYAGLAFESEGERCAKLLTDPARKIMVMGNHGVLATGQSVAEAFHYMYYFERAARTYIRALATGRPLRVMSDAVAERTAREIEAYPDSAERMFSDLMAILDREEPDYRD